MTLTTSQSIALNHLKRAYVGPEQGEAEILLNRPSLQYAVGMLFPLEGTSSAGEASTDQHGSDEFLVADVEEGDVEEDGAAPPLAEDWRPSSVALSFVTAEDSFLCDLSAANYVVLEDDGPIRWARQPHRFPGLVLERGEATHRQLHVGDLSVEVGSRWRNLGGGWLVTVHVRLLSTSSGNDRDDIPLMLFQVDLSVRPRNSRTFLEYDAPRTIDMDAESRELRLRYRESKVYGVGHGMAAAWDLDASRACTRVFLDPVPHFVVPSIEQAASRALNLTAAASQSMDLAYLSSIDADREAVTAALDEFVDAFTEWASLEVEKAEPLGEDAREIAQRSVVVAGRMRAGVALLADGSNVDIRTAFALSMAAMRMQMRQAALSRGVTDSVPAWRPFQLGFLLVALASAVEDRHPDRELVDLIWFPTGGGKTEAYLALAAVVIFLRRLSHGAEGAGTAVITRYTLRLLTAQQFQRAASLICAMELLRKGDPRARGMARFTIGLWVGNDATPGTRAAAKHALERLHKARNPKEANEFQITDCPWCLSELVPDEKDDTRRSYGARLVGNDVVFRCVSSDCEFNSRDLPLAVVDEVLYDDPPTFLLATVDKFARLQFDDRAGRLLGIGTAFRQPSLIIQDELHLLSGPLGTTVAVFDGVIELLLSRSGSHPKIVAATATIRASREQVQGLYGRAVALYPPPSLDGDTTFFARPIESGEGRLYIGLMPQSVSQATATIASTSPLFELPTILASTNDAVGVRDPYWTLVLYHNSLRELGRSGALLLDDINGRLETRAERLGTKLRKIRAACVLELTSRRGPEELPNDLQRLTVSADKSDEAVDIVLSSNMLSVGIDVQRLALMLMIGQPKTTAEYIQATSRVGRGSVNGIIATLFRSNRARDRSHFETFRGYHDALYRGVEPTSVTPWSLSSRERSLAGALVALLRQWFPLLAGDADAGQFDLSDGAFLARLEPVVNAFLTSVARADENEHEDAAEQAWMLLREWDRLSAAARADGKALRYERRQGVEAALLRRFGQPGMGWMVGDSMRSVEPKVAVEVQEPLMEVTRAEDQA